MKVDGRKVDPETGEFLQDELGFELPDPTPVAPPLGYVKQPSMFDIIRAQVQQQLSAIALAEGKESWEDAEDFDVGDDFDPISPHEGAWDLSVEEIKQALNDARRRKVAMTEPDPAPPPAVPPAPAPAPAPASPEPPKAP